MTNESDVKLDLSKDVSAQKVAFEQARSKRNNVVGFALAGLAIMFFLVTLVKLSGNG